jgi:hypothetical protein
MIMPPDWNYIVDGEDLVVRNIYATAFGGRYDKGDNGQTESGFPNDGSYPWFLGVALPIRSTEVATAGSPLAFAGPHIPWFTPVHVWLEAAGEQSAVVACLIDNGPDVLDFPNHALDMNPPLAALFAGAGVDPVALVNDWSTTGISYRIVGGAKWIS